VGPILLADLGPGESLSIASRYKNVGRGVSRIAYTGKPQGNVGKAQKGREISSLHFPAFSISGRVISVKRLALDFSPAWAESGKNV